MPRLMHLQTIIAVETCDECKKDSDVVRDEDGFVEGYMETCKCCDLKLCWECLEKHREKK